MVISIVVLIYRKAISASMMTFAEHTGDRAWENRDISPGLTPIWFVRLSLLFFAWKHRIFLQAYYGMFAATVANFELHIK